MDDNSNFSTSGSILSGSTRALFAAAALTITLAACGANTSPGTQSQANNPPVTPDVASADIDGQSRVGDEIASVDAVEVTAVSRTDTVATTTTTVAPPTTTSTLTPAVEPEVLTPAEVQGSYEDLLTNQRVLTAVDDPLNVRTGPGAEYEAVGRLAHEADDIVATHAFNVAEGITWRYVEQNGEAIGWVHANFLFGQGATSTCQAGSDFPEFEGAVLSETGDVDLDGVDDEIFVLAESRTVGESAAGFPVVEYDAWLLVSFANGGVATGQWTGDFEPTSANPLHVFDLTTLTPANDWNEVVFPIGQGASHGQWGVMTLDGCSLVPTTLDGVPFGFSSGASAGHSTVGGCAYGPHGEIEFSISSRNFNTGEWGSSTYQLNGSEWLEVGTLSGTATAGDDFPHAPTLANCVGVS